MKKFIKNQKIKYILIIFFWSILATLSSVFSTWHNLVFAIPISILSGWMIGTYVNKLKRL